jgi:hypothetical protein
MIAGGEAGVKQSPHVSASETALTAHSLRGLVNKGKSAGDPARGAVLRRTGFD